MMSCDALAQGARTGIRPCDHPGTIRHQTSQHHTPSAEHYSLIRVTATTRVSRRSIVFAPKPGRGGKAMSPRVQSNPDGSTAPAAVAVPLATRVESGAPARRQKSYRRLLSLRFSVFFGSCVARSPNQTNHSRTLAVGTVRVSRWGWVTTCPPCNEPTCWGVSRTHQCGPTIMESGHAVTRTLAGGCLLSPLKHQRVEVRSRGLHELAEEVALNKGAGTRGIPDVATFADVEERHLVLRHEDTQRIVVVRDHDFRRCAMPSEGRGLFGQSLDCFSCFAGRHHWRLNHRCLPECAIASVVSTTGSIITCWSFFSAVDFIRA